MTMDNSLAPPTTRITAGPWLHRGQMIVSVMKDDGTLMRVTLPDDLAALVARVQTLERRMGPEQP